MTNSSKKAEKITDRSQTDEFKERMALNHAAIWHSFELLSRACNVSPSALARRAGLDGTSFNPSKRYSPEGRPRWPSTETLFKALEAADMGVKDFAELMVQDHHQKHKTLPMINLYDASKYANQGILYDQNGLPDFERLRQMTNSDEIVQAKLIDELEDKSHYFMRVGSDAYGPFLTAKSQLLIAPKASIHKDDLILIKFRNVEKDLLLRRLIRQTVHRLEVKDICLNLNEDIAMMDIAWISRIQWITP